MAARLLTDEICFDAQVTGALTSTSGGGPRIILRREHPSALPLHLPVPAEQLKAWGARIGDRVRVRITIEPE